MLSILEAATVVLTVLALPIWAGMVFYLWRRERS
jgi:hypothetical protein